MAGRARPKGHGASGGPWPADTGRLSEAAAVGEGVGSERLVVSNLPVEIRRGRPFGGRGVDCRAGVGPVRVHPAALLRLRGQAGGRFDNGLGDGGAESELPASHIPGRSANVAAVDGAGGRFRSRQRKDDSPSSMETNTSSTAKRSTSAAPTVRKCRGCSSTRIPAGRGIRT